MVSIQELEDKIKESAQKYYTDGSSELSDEEFDNLVAELRQRNPDSKLFRTGWGYSVQDDTTPGDKVRHKYGLVGSLDKCRTLKEIGKDYLDSAIYVSLKLDGMTVVLNYVNGELVQAVTRGDGIVGIDITNKISVIDNRLLFIKDKTFTGAVRGEILMSYEAFEKYQEIEPSAKNPRNTCVGLISQKEVTDKLSYLDILVYSVIGDESRPNTIGHIAEVYDFLEANFDLVVPHSCETLKPMMNMWKYKLESLRDSWYGKYPADGIVLNQPLTHVDDNGYVSYTGKAFKFPAESKQTTVVDVKWNHSKSNLLIPVVEIVPTLLSGATVTYVTGYHASYIEENKIGKEAIIEVTRSGEVIPKIVKVIEPGQVDIPTVCPACGQPLKKDVHLYCDNRNCSNLAIQDTLVWLKTLAPVKGLGDNLIFKFIQELFEKPTIECIMSNPSAVLNLDSRSGQSKLIYEMLETVYSSKFTLPKALEALNIPRLGNITAEKLGQYPQLIQQSIVISVGNCLPEFDYRVGQATANSIADNTDRWQRLKLIQDRILWESNSVSKISKGKVAITGKLSVKRSDFEKELKAAGYTIGDITKDTKFLITDDPNSPSSKNLKADKLGITKITELNFRKDYM